MFSLPWSKKQSKDEVVAIIHIGSSVVSGGLVMLHAGVKRHTCATILMAETIDLEINPERLSLRNYLPKLFSGLDQLVNKILAAEDKFGRPHRVCFFLPSLLALSQNRLTRTTNKDGINISQSSIEELALNESDRFLAENPTLYPELTGDATVVLESEIIGVKADGYNIELEASGLAKELAVTTRLVLTSRELVRQLKERARKLNPLSREVSLRTFVSSAAHVLTSIPGEQNFVILDPTGILTDFVIIKDGSIIAEGSFPLGQVTLVERLAKSLNTTNSEALSTIKLIKSGDLSTKAGKVFNQAAERFRQDWLSSLKKILATSLQSHFLPETIFVNGGSAADDLFINWLTNDGLGELTVSRQGPKIISITPNLWSSWCLVPQSINALPALSLEGVFCDKIRSGI